MNFTHKAHFPGDFPGNFVWLIPLIAPNEKDISY